MKSVNLFKTFLFLFVSLSVFLILIGINFLRIKEIKIYGIEKLNGVDRIRNLYGPLINMDKVAKTLIKENPYVHNLRVLYIFPNTIWIEATPNKPIAYIIDDYKKIVLGEDGRIIGVTDKNLDLPEITYNQVLGSNYLLGEKIPGQEVVKALQIIKSLKGKIKPLRIDILGNGMIVSIIGEKKILFGGKRNIEEEIKDALFMMRELEKEGMDYRTLDVRFLKPVVSIYPYELSNIDSN